MTPSPQSPLNPVHLLLVDDDRLVLSTLGTGLRNLGYQVSTAECMADAETLLFGGQRPDLTILDVRMPGGDGLMLAQRLREFDHLPFIMLSAYSDTDIVHSAAALGALGYLVKPLDAGRMAPTIEAALLRGADLRKLAANAEQLQHALNAERDVGVAVGITMAQNRLSRHAALDVLRNASRTQRRKLADLAQDVVQSIDRVHGA